MKHNLKESKNSLAMKQSPPIHFSYAEEKRPKGEGFTITIPSIY
jgi:hypothetical protein